MSIRLLVADVDGTLLDSAKQLTDGARDAVRALREAHVLFTLASSRPPFGLGWLVRELAIDLPFLAFNGALTLTPDLSILERHPLARDTTAQTFEVLAAHGLAWWAYDDADWYASDAGGPHVGTESAVVKRRPLIVADSADLPSPLVKVAGVTDDAAAMEACVAALRGRLGKAASVERSHPYYVDVTAPAALKGEAVARLAARVGVPLEKVATIGDMPTDVSMLKRAGLGIAMGNASAEVRAEADAVTSDDDHEGFANAVREFVLRGR